jgi:hypothetical protein
MYPTRIYAVGSAPEIARFKQHLKGGVANKPCDLVFPLNGGKRVKKWVFSLCAEGDETLVFDIETKTKFTPDYLVPLAEQWPKLRFELNGWSLITRVEFQASDDGTGAGKAQLPQHSSGGSIAVDYPAPS